MIGGIPLSVLTAIYTAYLFAQAKARDLWQNPLLPPHLLIQSLLLGAAVLLLASFALSPWIRPANTPGLSEILAGMLGAFITLAISTGLHLLMIWGEVSLTHGTAHTRLAIWEMIRGRYKEHFWIGITLSFASLFLLVAPFGFMPPFNVGAAIMGLIGVMLYEHAYVQAGQSVPLA
jgi:Ni/Fe-hydrogenase subunit HybB-like protein